MKTQGFKIIPPPPLNVPHNFSVKHSFAFTLIELMSVITIIGILVTVGLPAYREYAYNAKLAEGYLSVDAVNKAQITFFNAHGGFICECPTPETFVGIKSSPIDTAERWRVLDMPLDPSNLSYFGVGTLHAGWDSDGNTRCLILEDEDDLEPVWDRGGCYNNIDTPIDLGKVIHPETRFPCESGFVFSDFQSLNRQIAFTSASNNLKGEVGKCTVMFQTVIADNDDVRTGPMITIRE